MWLDDTYQIMFDHSIEIFTLNHFFYSWLERKTEWTYKIKITVSNLQENNTRWEYTLGNDQRLIKKWKLVFMKPLYWNNS